MTARATLVRLHRWTGLGLAGFLILVSVTGSAIAWNDAGERLFAPSLFVLPRAATAKQPLDPFTLREFAERAAPGFAINNVDFTRRPDEPARFLVVGRPGGPLPSNDEIALDPSTGKLVGARRNGDLSQGAVNIMPFIYSVHDGLAVGNGGAVVLGIVALVWTIDCFVGLWLTFPGHAHPRRTPSAWTQRWSRAWRVRWPTRPFKLTFDLHSAMGLWVWLMLGVQAWSATSFNLPVVYQPVMRALFGLDETPAIRLPTVPAASPPALGWRQAHRVGQRAMADEARRYGFTVSREWQMFYDAGARTYAYSVKSSLDLGKRGDTQLTLDADTGRILAFTRPTGGRFGTTFTTWIKDLHTARVWGWPMHVFQTLMGLAVSMLSVTGLMIWLRKRRAKH